jgi:hypothetical protein
VYSGRAALTGHAAANTKTTASIGQVVYNVLIEPAVGGAAVTSYVVITTSQSQAALLSGIAAGHFHDALVKTAAGWRIRKRSWTNNQNFSKTKVSLAPTISLRATVKPVRVHAAPEIRREGALTALDYFEIQQLYQRFSRGFDTAEDNGAMFAKVFSPTGTYTAPDGKTYRGTSELAAYAKQDPEERKGPTNISVFNSSIRIEAAPAGATGKSYVMVMGKRRATPSLSDAGNFLDAFVRTADGWRIQSRVFCRLNTECTSPQPTGPVVPMTVASAIAAEDYAEILQLYARYTYTWDGELEDGAQFIELFTPNGSHINESDGAKEFFFGREELRGFARQRKMRDNRGPGTMGHFLTNVMLEKIPDGIASKLYRISANISKDDGSVRFGVLGLYYDYLVKTDEGWFFDRKQFMTANGPLPANALKENPLPPH